MSCSTCYEVNVHRCLKNLAIALGLDASTDYIVKFIDQFDNVYPVNVTTDGSGNILITDVEDVFPEGFFIKGRTFTIEIFTDAGLPVEFTIGDDAYKCFSVLVDGETNENALIPPPASVVSVVVSGVTYKKLPAPTGAIDAVNTVFTFVMKPEQIFTQGPKLVENALTNGYTLSGAGNNIATLTEAPQIGDSVEGYANF